MNPLARLDQAHVWHPFTQMRDWVKEEPIVIVSGKGAWLEDVNGKKYLDANSSIWTNLHGHGNRKLDSALKAQLRKVAHTSALGYANEPASILAGKLVELASRLGPPDSERTATEQVLSKVFFSDDGSTAMEVALKMAYEHARRTGLSSKPRFLSLGGAYHGDTVGAVSVGHIDLFHKTYSGLLFDSDQVPAPYCYRCPYNKAEPERRDAREYRKCHFECLDQVRQKLQEQKRSFGEPYGAFFVEPLMQGAAGMIAQPKGWLSAVVEMIEAEGTPWVADEVMTGFGRTGTTFACEQENVRPDFLVLAKGMTGGYLPMAATLTHQKIFEVFLGEYEEFKTFFHGHSYTGNQLGSAVALASLEILDSEGSRENRQKLQEEMTQLLAGLWALENVGDIRQVGLIAGIELVKDWRTREPFRLEEKVGIRVCKAMSNRGVLTRPVGNVVVLMPPYVTRPSELKKMVQSLRESVEEVVRTAA